MTAKNLIGLVLLLFALPLAADVVKLNPNHPDRYVVVKGDTLWDISGRFLEKPWRWPEIWHINPQIEDPHWIYPGDVIALEYVNGQPVLTLQRGGGMRNGRDIKLSPSVREYSHDEAIKPIPLDAIQQFLSRPRVVTKEQLDAAPYVVASYDEHLVAGSGNKIYVRSLDAKDRDTAYGVYRPGEVYRNPGAAKDDILGYEALFVADASVEKTGDPASLVVTRAEREVLIGDRLLPLTQEPIPYFVPHAPAAGIDGSIIAVVDGVSQIGQYQIVVLNKGGNDGLDQGTVLAIFQSGAMVRDRIGTEPDEKTRKRQEQEHEAGRIHFQHEDSGAIDSALTHIVNDVRENWHALTKRRYGGVDVELPEERIGELMVFRSFDRISYALIMQISRPVHIHDSVRNP